MSGKRNSRGKREGTDTETVTDAIGNFLSHRHCAIARPTTRRRGSRAPWDCDGEGGASGGGCDEHPACRRYGPRDLALLRVGACDARRAPRACAASVRRRAARCGVNACSGGAHERARRGVVRCAARGSLCRCALARMRCVSRWSLRLSTACLRSLAPVMLIRTWCADMNV